MTRIADDSLLAFHFGLNTFQHVGDVPRLPQGGIAPAVETQTILQLEALFEPLTLDDSLQLLSTPVIENTKVLEPAVYAAALDDAQRLLLHRAKTGSPEEARLFLDALSVLEEAQADRDLLQTGQFALMRA